MPKIPRIPAKKVIQKLKKVGFTETHQRGSHLYLENGKRVVTVPIHGGGVPPGTLYNIIVRQAGMKIKEFIDI